MSTKTMNVKNYNALNKTSSKSFSSLNDEFIDVVNTLRNEAKKNNISGMSLKEINRIIKATRKNQNL
ncbi:MAG: hypothetical protein IKI71_02265 [Lachnospiraceae bacterium]|nr:hypothetical protein [Lachnospiraceae bacterium]